VRDVLRGIDEEPRNEWPYRRIILPPLEITGVDQLLDSSIVILTRLKTPEPPMARVTHVHRLAEPANASSGA
jgi:hypothetical protein